MTYPAEKPNLVVYHNQLLPLSTTFIRSQAASVQRFNVGFAGLYPSYGPSLDLKLGFGPILLTKNHNFISRVRAQIYRRTGLLGGRFLHDLAAARPALIHAHFALDATFAMRISEALKIPLVTTLHGYDVTIRDEVLAERVDGRIFLRNRQRLQQQCAHFFCSCDYIKERAAAMGYPREKLETLYSGHDFAKFDLPDTPRNRNLVLFVGRLIEKKGCEYLLRAAALAAKDNPDIEVAVIGEGPLKQQLVALARELKVNCNFLGNLAVPEPGNTVFDWMKRARVFCMPSVMASNGDTEGQPAVFVEAHALGLPAVSFQNAGIGEVVLHDETGLLVPERDTAALAQALLRMTRDDTMWARFSERAPVWVRERFESARLNEQLERAYLRVLNLS